MAVKEATNQAGLVARPDPIFVAIEMSRSKWIVGSHIPGADKVSLHSLDCGDAAGLFTLISKLQDRTEKSIGIRPPTLCCYEAGFEGFWLQRLLATAGHGVLVIDPASLLVNRRAKRAKTDRIDARAMVRALIGFNRGEDRVLNAIHVPTVEQEDERRLLRERHRLVKERTAHTNRIKGLLVTQGIVGFDPRARGAAQALATLRTGDGRPLGPRLSEELARELLRLRMVMDQLAVIESERDRLAATEPEPATEPGQRSGAPDRAMISELARLKGIGANDATLLVREAFWRDFKNRRELAAWSGLAPTPWSSGAVTREQGITKAGPPLVRAQLVQMSWRWLLWQPQSELAQWFQKRTLGGAGRVRRVMIVALARKLLVSLWRYATLGLVPTGAIVV